MSYDDSLAHVTRSELHEFRIEVLARLDRMATDIQHMATEASVERMGRIMIMWMVATMVGAVAAVVGVMLALPRP